jgi:hypothetical protein
MASPVYSTGTPGNLISAVTVTHGVTNAVAAFLDLSTDVEGQVTVEVITPSPSPTAIATFSAYKAYAAGGSAPITLTANAVSGQTSVSLSSKSGLSVGQKVCLQQASGSKLGEIVTVSSVTGSSSPYTLTTTVNLVNSYSTGDGLYYMSQTAVYATQPSSSTGTYGASSEYSAEMLLGPGQYVIGVVNGDASYNFTTNVTVDKITAIQ